MRCRLTSWDLPHYVPSAGVRLTAPGLVVAYTGDTGPSPHLAELGRDADLFIVEATDGTQQAGSVPPPDGPRLHLSSHDARSQPPRQPAADAHPLWPGNARELSRGRRGCFSGEVLLAEEGLAVAF